MGTMEFPYSFSLVNYLAEKLVWKHAIRSRRSWASQLIDLLADDASQLEVAEGLIRQLSEHGMGFRVMGSSGKFLSFKGLINTAITEIDIPTTTEGLRFPELPLWQGETGEIFPLEMVYAFGSWTLKTADC